MIYYEPTHVARIVRERIASEDLLLRLTSLEYGFDVMFMIRWLPDYKCHVAVPTVCQNSCWYSALIRVPKRLYYLIRRRLRVEYGLKHIHLFEPLAEEVLQPLAVHSTQNPAP